MQLDEAGATWGVHYGDLPTSLLFNYTRSWSSLQACDACVGALEEVFAPVSHARFVAKGRNSGPWISSTPQCPRARCLPSLFVRVRFRDQAQRTA